MWLAIVDAHAEFVAASVEQEEPADVALGRAQDFHNLQSIGVVLAEIVDRAAPGFGLLGKSSQVGGGLLGGGGPAQQVHLQLRPHIADRLLATAEGARETHLASSVTIRHRFGPGRQREEQEPGDRFQHLRQFWVGLQ